MYRSTVVPAVLIVASGLVLAGCAATPPSSPSADGLQVVATTTQVADYTRNVIGDLPVQVTQLVDAGASLHGFDPSAANMLTIGGADLLVITGAGLDGWIDEAAIASGFDGVVVDTSASIDLATSLDANAEEAPESEEADSDHDEHGDEELGGGDPHVWHNVENAIVQTQEIIDALAQADPANASSYEQNGAEYIGSLESLNDWIHQNVDTVPEEERFLVTSHDAFGHMVDALSLNFVGAVIPSTDDNAEASAATMDALIAKIRAAGVSAVFAETSISPAAAETIANETGATVYAGENALYGDSLGPVGTPGETYIGSEIHNVSLLLQSWGVTPTALPATLEDK